MLNLKARGPRRRRAADDVDKDEPPEVQELMDELANEGNPGSSATAGSPARAKSGLHKSAELIALGTVSAAAAFLSAVSDAVDCALLALPGGKRALGVHQRYVVHACRLSEYLAAAARWNAEAAPLQSATMVAQRAALLAELNRFFKEMDSLCEEHVARLQEHVALLQSRVELCRETAALMSARGASQAEIDAMVRFSLADTSP